jgi:hypothetical protein
MSTLSIAGLNSAFTFALAETEQERSGVYDLRQSIWVDEFPYLLKPATTTGHPAKDEFDDRSWVFACRNGDEVVGSCRCSPMLDGRWEISSSLPPDVELTFDPNVTVQLDRVYVRAGHRNICLHEFLFYHFSNWMLRHTPYERYFAVCNAGLVRLYRKLGAKLAHGGIRLIGRGSHKYYIVEGNISHFNAIMKQLYSL